MNFSNNISELSTKSRISSKHYHLHKFFTYEKYNKISNNNTKQFNSLGTQNSITSNTQSIITFSIKDYVFFKKKPNSNGSRKLYKLNNPLPIIFKFKPLYFVGKNRKGRSNKGVIICRTKGSLRKKIPYPKLKTSFRYLNLSLIINIFIIPFRLRILSLIVNSSGCFLYLNTTHNHTLFSVSKLYSILHKTSNFNKNLLYLSNFIKIPQLFFLIIHLPKHKFISFLEIYPHRGVKYVKSPGSKATLKKTDFLRGLGLVKLPSGVHKIFSIYSVGSLGVPPLTNTKLLMNVNAGYNKNLGQKSLSRGIAKNPIDHPHGGRSKAIRYQRTPWGKTTKYK